MKGQVTICGHNLPSLDDIRLTDLPQSGGVHPPPLATLVQASLKSVTEFYNLAICFDEIRKKRFLNFLTNQIGLMKKFVETLIVTKV